MKHIQEKFRKMWRGFGFLSILVLGMSIGLEQSFAASEPIVYTGYLHHDALAKDQLVRIFFQKSLKLGATTPYLSAQVILYFGESGGTEYSDLYYEPIGHNATTRELFFQRNDDARGRRLPIIKLVYDAAGATMTGSFTSMTEGSIGTLALSKGWDAQRTQHSAELIQPLAGIFEATCDAEDGSAMSIDEVELVPSRIFTDRVSPEGTFNAINYIGNANCEHDGLVNCVHFTSGTYNFFRDSVHLMQGGWAWECVRTSSEDLSCSSPRYPHCTLSRRARTTAPTEGRTISTAVRPITADVPATRLAETHECDAWQGEFNGVLTHALSRKTQNIKINLTSFMVQSPPSLRCQTIGSAQLYFHDPVGVSEVMTYPLPQLDIDGGLADQVFYSDNYTDLVLDVHQDEQGVLTGSWYSKIFGYVGTFSAARNTVPAVSTSASVPGLRGSYIAANDTSRKASLLVTEAGFDKSSHDPYAQIGLSGTFTKEVVIDGRTILWPDYVQVVSYDFFTGYIVVRTSNALYYGFVDRQSMQITGMPRNYMTLSHPFSYQYVFRRTP